MGRPNALPVLSRPVSATRRCETCRWWGAHDEKPSWGLCRRHAPHSALGEGGINLVNWPYPLCLGDGWDPLYLDAPERGVRCPCCAGARELTTEFIQTGPDSFEYRQLDGPQIEFFEGVV